MNTSSVEATFDSDGFRTKEELVTFTNVLSQYVPDSEVTFRYTLGSRVRDTDLDWIGIFPSDWCGISQPLTFQWAPIHGTLECQPLTFQWAPTHGTLECQPRERSATFPGKLIQPLQHPTDTYLLVYVNNQSQVIGISPSFRVRDAGPELENVISADVRSRDNHLSNGDAKSSKSDSPVILSSDDEWDFHTYSSHNSSTSFSDLSDIADLPSPQSKIVAKEKLKIGTADARKDHDSDNDNPLLFCTAKKVQQNSSLCDLMQRENISNLVPAYNLPVKETGVVETNIEFKWAKPQNILPNVLTNNASEQIAVETCSNEKHEIQIIEQKQIKSKDFIKMSKKQAPVKKGEDIWNPRFQIPMTPSLRHQLEIINTQKNQSGDDESSCHSPKYKLNFSTNKTHVNSVNHEFSLSNMFALKNTPLFNVAVHYKSSDKREKEIKRRMPRRRREIKHRKHNAFYSVRKKTQTTGRAVGNCVDQKHVTADKSGTNSLVKPNNELCRSFKTLKDLGLVNNSSKQSKYEDTQTSDSEINSFSTQHNGKKLELTNKRATNVERIIQLIRSKKTPRPNMQFEFALSHGNKDSFTNKTRINSCADNILSDEKNLNVEQSFSDSVADKWNDDYALNQMENKKTRMRLQTTVRTPANSKLGLLSDSSRILQREKSQEENIFQSPQCHEGNEIIKDCTYVAPCQSSQELLSAASSPGCPRMFEVKVDIEGRQGNEMSDAGSENESLQDESEDYVSSSTRNPDNALPPSCRGVADVQSYREDGLKKSTYLKVGILERIKHHLSKCEDNTIFEKDLLTCKKEQNAGTPGHTLAEASLFRPSNQKERSAGDHSDGRASLLPKTWPSSIFAQTRTSRNDDVNLVENGRVNTAVYISGLQKNDVKSYPIEPISWASAVDKSKNEHCCQEVSQEGKGRFFRDFLSYKSSNSSAHNKTRAGNESKKSQTLSLNVIKSHKDLKNKLLKNAQTLQCKQRQDLGNKLAMQFCQRPIVPNCTENVHSPLASSETAKAIQNLSERFRKLSESTESFKTRDCSDRQEKLGGQTNNTGNSVTCLDWPLPAFNRSSLCFGPWVTQIDSPDHRQVDDEDTQLHTSKFLHIQQQRSDFYNNRMFMSSTPRSETLKRFFREKAEMSEEVNGRTCQGETEQAAVLEQGTLKAKLEKLKKYLDLDNQQKQSGDCISKAELASWNGGAVRHRRVALVKCAGDVKNMIRSNAEIQMLKSKVTCSDLQVQDLTVQLAALKEALMIKSRMADRANLKWLKLKNEVKDQKLKPKYSEATKHDASLNRTTESVGDELNIENQYQRRPFTRRMATCTKEKTETRLWRPGSTSERISRDVSEPSSNPDPSNDSKMAAIHLPEMTSNSATIMYSQTDVSDEGFKFRMSGFPAAYDSRQEQTSSGLQNSWACQHPTLSTTSCYPNAVSSYYDQLVTHAYKNPLDSTFNCQQIRNQVYDRAPLYSHLQSTSPRYYLPAKTASPSNEPPKSLLYNNLIQEPFSRAAHYNNLPNPSSQSMYSALRHRPPEVNSPTQLTPKRTQFSSLSCNNSRNKSRDSSATDYEEVISPLSSPSILPVPNSQSSIVDRTVRIPAKDIIAEYSNASRHLEIVLPPRTNVTQNTPFHTHQDFCEHPDFSRSGINILDSSLYWPSKSIDYDQPDFTTKKILTASVSELNVKRIPKLHENASKPKARVKPFNISEQSPANYGNNKKLTFAFASGATVCQESGHDDSLSGGLCRWLKSVADQDASSFLTSLSSHHLLSENEEESHLSESEIAFPQSVPTVDENMSSFSKFQSCFLRHLVQDERQEKYELELPTHQLDLPMHQRDLPKHQHDLSKHQHELPNHQLQQSKHQLQPSKHHLQLPTQHRLEIEKQKYNNLQECQHNLSPVDFLKPIKCTYPKPVLSIPPSELPFPPLSPFHHPPSTHPRKVNVESEKEQFSISDFVNQSIVKNVPQRSALVDNPCPVQQQRIRLPSTSIFKPACPNFDQSIAIFQKPHSPPGLILNRFKGVSCQTQSMSFVSLIDSELNKRQIEATESCQGDKQQ